jgi:hypothetical protein
MQHTGRSVIVLQHAGDRVVCRDLQVMVRNSEFGLMPALLLIAGSIVWVHDDVYECL